MESTPLQLILQASVLVKLVLGLLMLFSVVSWAIIIYKLRFLSKVEAQNKIFVRALRAGDPKTILAHTRMLELSPAANLFKSAYTEAGNSQSLKAALDRQLFLETDTLERYLNFLATTGSTTPFIGLFGTVWGIMNAFRGIGMKGSASLAIVAPGIAEALITTAMGLVAAIPAVIGYNYYLGRTRRIVSELDTLSAEIEMVLAGNERQA